MKTPLEYDLEKYEHMLDELLSIEAIFDMNEKDLPVFLKTRIRVYKEKIAKIKALLSDKPP